MPSTNRRSLLQAAATLPLNALATRTFAEGSEAAPPHAIGSVEVPMTDQQLETKFSDLADGILPAPMIRRVMDACWNVEGLPNAAEIAKMSVSA